MDNQRREIERLSQELTEARSRLSALEANDLAERRRFEEALRASEQNYREIFNSTMNAVFVHEIPSGRILDVNQTMLDMYGCSREEAFQMAFWRKVSAGPPFTPAEAIRVIRKAATEGQQVVQWPVRRNNGERFWVEVTVKRATIGGVPRVLVIQNDITDRKRSEEALKASERNYREIFNATMNAIFIHEIPTGRILDVNQTMLDMYGLSRDEALQSTVNDISVGRPPYSQEEAVELINKAATGGSQIFEWHCRRKNGEPFWVEVILKQAVIGGVPRVLALVNDIDDRKRAEEALVESQRKLSGAVSIAKLGYWEHDLANNLFTFDDHFYAIFHTTAEDMGGYTMSSGHYAEHFVHPDDAHVVADEVRAALETTDPSYSRQLEHRILYADGGIGHIAVRFFIVKDEQGRTIKTYGANQDITDRKRAEEALKASEQNYREIFNSSASSIVVLDIATGQLVDANQAMLDLHGLSREEALRSDISDFSVNQPPYTQQQAIELMNKAASEGAQNFEWHCRRKDGQTFWVEVVMQGAIIGGVPRMLALAQDISDRKQAQQRLLDEQQTLRQLLESQERERRLIAYEIHDGLAQQLAAAAMYCGNFEQLRQTNPEEAIKSHEAGVIMLEKALAETRRLIGGLRPAVLDESGLVAAVENLISNIEAEGTTKIEFLTDVHFDRLNPARENSLFRIVQESLTNAGRYSGSQKIRVHLAQEADHLVLEIQDWGSGFDPDEIAQSCFGLKGICERASLLGGQATIESAPGEGTRIRVELPMEENNG